MNQQQFNTDKIDKLLGADIDMEQAWKEFEEKQNRKRPTLFLWFGLILLIGVTTLYLQGVKSKQQISQLKIDDTFKTQKEIITTTLEQSLLIADKEAIVEVDTNNKKLDTALSITSMPSFEQSKNIEIEKKSKRSIEATQNLRDITFLKNTNISTTDYTQNDRTSMFNTFSTRITSPRTKAFEERTIIEPIMTLQENSRNDIDTDTNYGISTLKRATMPPAIIGRRLGFPLISVKKRLDSLALIIPQHTIVNSSSRKSLSSLNFYSSAGVMQRMLNTNTDNFQLKRANNEIPIYRYAFGALVSKRIKSKFKVSIGLEYNNYVSKIEELIQNIGQSVIIENQLIAYKIKDGVSEPVYGNISATSIEVVKNIRFQQYRSFAIPVNLGYMKKLKKGFSMEVGGGFSYHFSMSTIGKTYKEDGAIGAYQSLSNLPYRTANLIDFNLHTGIHKTISDQLSLGLKAVYNRDLNSRILPSSNFTDKFSSLNLELSLTRYF